MAPRQPEQLRVSKGMAIAQVLEAGLALGLVRGGGDGPH